MSNSLWPHGLQHARLPCPSPSPRVCPSSCPLNWWFHPVTSFSVALFFFFFCLQSLPASGSFPMSRLFASGGQSIGTSASAWVLPMSIQGWFLLSLTGLISLLPQRLSRVFTSTTVSNLIPACKFVLFIDYWNSAITLSLAVKNEKMFWLSQPMFYHYSKALLRISVNFPGLLIFRINSASEFLLHLNPPFRLYLTVLGYHAPSIFTWTWNSASL